MLARLDTLPGIEESRVDWTGRYVLLKLRPGTDPAAVVPQAGEILAGGVRPLEGPAAEVQLASFRRGEPWMRSGETLRMSIEESKVLSLRLAQRAARDAGLEEDRTRRLEGLLKAELDAAIGGLHASGKPPDRTRFRRDWERLVDGLVERSRAFLDEAEASRVKEALLRGFGR